jgi:ABC-type Fe3+/spermidine/putrescine transport system ATPase subunit
VAEFIGKTNRVEAVGEGGDDVRHGGLRLRVVAAARGGAAVTVSIRPHAIALVRAGEPAPPAENLLTGLVKRVTYLGETFDYQVRVDGADLALRVSAPPPCRAEPGERVSLAMPAAACVILAPEAA